MEIRRSQLHNFTLKTLNYVLNLISCVKVKNFERKSENLKFRVFNHKIVNIMVLLQ